MGNLQSGFEKVIGLQLPGQSGKTKKMEESLTKFMIQAREQTNEDDLNIMFTANSKLLVEQTSSRINDDLGPLSDDESLKSNDSNDDSGDVILRNGTNQWVSSSKNVDINAMYGDIIDDEVDMIICCSNSLRFKKVDALLTRLQKSPKFNKKINIYVDEAHKIVKILKRYYHTLSHSKIKSIMLVSASWDNLDKIWKIPRLTYKATHPDVYRTLRECEWKIVEPLISDNESIEDDTLQDLSTTAPGYITQILQNAELRKCIEKPGTCWLIPGNSKTITHDAIAEYLLERGWNGLKLNGKEKALTIHIDKLIIDYTEYNTKKQEPKDVLQKLFQDYVQLKNAPFFITGLNCIKEGITFQGEAFMFDGAIIPNMKDASDAYQLACRLAGNLKGFPLYQSHKTPLIITSSRMKKKINRQENIAIFLPRILYEEGRNIPTDFDKNRAARGYVPHDPMGFGYRVFSRYETYYAYISDMERRSLFTKEPNGGDEYPGKHICSVQSSRGAKTKPRYLREVIDKIALAYGGGSATKTGFPCYLDIDTAPDGLVWVVVISDKMQKDKINAADLKNPDESAQLLPLAKDYQ